MRRVSFIAATGVVLALGLNALPAHAQANRTFVSGHGSDSNPCSIALPCRSFAFAITQTNARGEIAVLDTAGYGTVTITKAVSIINQDGVEAGITTASATDAITIAAGANDVVNLRGLTLVGGFVGNNGITFTSGGTLNIQNCAIRGFLQKRTQPDSGRIQPVQRRGYDRFQQRELGILVNPTGAGTTTGALFERVQAIGNTNGFAVDGSVATGTLQATATNSDASGNVQAFFVQSFTGAVTTFTIVNSTVANNSTGLKSNGPKATMFVAGSTVSGNSAGFIIQPTGVIKTFGNNNITDTNSGTLTKVSQQ